MTLEEYCSTIETKMKGGLLSLIVLYIISSVETPIHGYLISKSVKTLTADNLLIQAGTLYPILKTLENHGLIEHEMIKSTEGPPRKIYRITQSGAVAINKLFPEMDNLFDSIRKVRDADWSQIIS